MSTNDTTAPAASTELVKLEKAHIDLRSVKIQMVLAALLILVTCVASRWQIIASGGLPGDEDSRTMELISTMFSETSGLSAVAFCHPLFMLSLLPDTFLVESFPRAPLLLNLCIVFATSLMVGLVVLEITGLYGNRLGAAPAMWAGLLSAVHPAQSFSDMAVVNRPDLLAHLFYVGALWSFLRFRLLAEKPYVGGSVLCLLLALLCGPFPETATYPIAALMAVWLLHGRPARATGLAARPSRSSIAYLLASALMVAGIFGASTALTAMEVNSPSGVLNRLHSDPISFTEAMALVLPVRSGEGGQAVMIGSAAAYVGCLGLQLMRVFMRASTTGPFLFASLWTFTMAAGMAVAQPQWLSEPQLAAVPVCVLLALAALPAVDAVGKRNARWLSIAGVITLSAAFLSWSTLLLEEVNKLQ